MTLAYLNGEFLAIEQARISPMDRGFLFGDSVYEVIPAFFGKAFRLEQHLQRLNNSIKAVRLNYRVDIVEWDNVIKKLLLSNGGDDQSIYIQISRGNAMLRDHAFPQNTPPTVFAYSTPFTPKSVDVLRSGVDAVTLPDIRWQFCNIKANTLLANILQRQQAIDTGANEAILIKDDMALEGTSSNLFIVDNNTIITPPNGKHILGGITRDLVLELAKQHGLPYREAMIPVNQLRQAQEIWLTGSIREITPVIKLDGKPVGASSNPVWEKIIQYYQDYKKSLK